LLGAHQNLINLYLSCGEYDKAIEQSQVYLSKLPGYGGAIRSAALAELFAGHYEKAQEYYQKRGGAPVEPGYLYWKSGKKEEALQWLQKALDSGMTEYRYYTRYPLFENIRDDERFKRIVDEVKIRVAEMRRRVEQMERDGSK